MTISITTTYNLVWQYLDSEYYFTKCGKCFNVKRSKELRRVLNGYSKGFTLNGKFETLEQISKKLIRVESKVKEKHKNNEQYLKEYLGAINYIKSLK